MKNKIVSTIKTSAGKLQLSEDAFCKHTIFIGSTGSGKTTSLNVLLRDIIGYNAEDETQKVGLLVFDLKGDNTLFKIRKWAKECAREDDVIDYCADLSSTSIHSEAWIVFAKSPNMSNDFTTSSHSRAARSIGNSR